MIHEQQLLSHVPVPETYPLAGALRVNKQTRSSYLFRRIVYVECSSSWNNRGLGCPIYDEPFEELKELKDLKESDEQYKFYN
ncbi:MAG: hypothetical protein EZS28_032408 [Streblomastix strix]|uniref:Uncharacterized protein n=1 Tax=Streblomastix strix TaxID=222440 RepID=A0A5J4UMZ3_9EUKA|nr:MAG: hypothetical protein EZS28_032408 [Streblomastix strix]